MPLLVGLLDNLFYVKINHNKFSCHFFFQFIIINAYFETIVT